MKNKSGIIFIIILIIFIFIIFFFVKNNNKNKFNNINDDNNNYYNSTKLSANMDQNSQISDNSVQNENILNSQIKHEELITSFSTKIYNTDSARQNNINITCSKLNDSIILNGSTFSFCDVVGQSTSSKGYQKADIFDKNGIKQKGLGGGNCQVSTTVYNAVLAVPNLVVIERHEHSNKVPYISTGKDAAVAYGSYDLKFRNDTGNDIRLKAESSNSDVTITLLKII